MSGTSLVQQVNTLWTTPQAHDVRQSGAGQTSGKTGNKAGNACLATDAAQWGTPRASDAEKGGPNQSFGAGGIPLPAQAAQWPTPAAQNVKGSSPDSVTRADGKSRMDILHYAAEQGFSRPGLPTWEGGLTFSLTRPISRRLFRLARKRRLNPLFVSWLQAWPIAHASCGYWGMASTHSAPLTRGEASPQHMDWSQHEKLHELRESVSTEEGEEQVLREALSASGIEDRQGIRSDSRWAGTQSCYGVPSRPEISSIRACPPQERAKEGQSAREPRGSDCAGTRKPASVHSSESQGLCGVWGHVHAESSDPQSREDVFSVLPIRPVINDQQAADFASWQRQMRAALSRLPTASAPWIWTPKVEAKAPEQMDLWG
jgi:hypothetical protein